MVALSVSQRTSFCKVESVQRRFTKRLNGLTGYSYSRRLAILGLESLELRRLHQDLIYTYKAMFGLIDIDCSKFFTVSPYSSTGGHDYKLFIQYSRVDARKYFGPTGSSMLGTSYPAKPSDLAGLNTFKSFLTNTDLSEFLNVFLIFYVSTNL